MSDERKEHDGESTEDLHRELGDVTEPDSSAGLEGRLERSQELPDHIGPFKILEILGEGGMGVVYLAEQTEPIRRRVALKLVKLGMDTKHVIARFESERQALALMNHPNVAKVFDAGATEAGRPYFVMEHVPGVPITEYCDQHRLNTRERLELFDHVCHAVQHAHQKGIIHRDIKPSNILVTVRDGQPVPKVIDFGVAKATQQQLTEKTLFTEQGQLIGTPEYMSPEQAEMTALDIDTRTDIYSLGVVLYELLAGALPFEPQSLRRGGFAEIQRIIREEEPPKPSTRLSSLGDESGTVAKKRRVDIAALARQLRGDLDWITMKALEKDRTRRYASATDLAADIDRHLKHQPVLAGPPSASYRARKFARRNRGLMVALGVITHVLMAATVVSIGFAVSEARQRRIAETATQEAEQARASEEEQRLLAQQREAEAIAARDEAEQARNSEEEQRKLAEQRADELETVTDFQSSMLSEVDAEAMGRGIFAGIREDIRAALKAKEVAPDRIDATIASFDETVRGVNATNLALQVVDEHVLSRAVATIEKNFADQPLVRAALQQTVADTYGEIGLYEPALPLQEACLRTRRRELGDDHPDTLSSINNMGLLLWYIGKFAKAEPYYREALTGRRRVLGDDHPDTLSSINNMGDLAYKMGKYAKAEPYYREALAGRRRVLGDDHPDTLESIHNMGSLLLAMGKYAEAEPYVREALEGRRRVLGDDHPDTLTSISNMGWLLWSMGKLAEAEPYFREALEGSRRVLGDDHLDTLGSIHNMGGLLESMGKLAEAEPYYREALESLRRVLGDDHPHTLTSINGMGGLLLEMGSYAKAEQYYREALEGHRRVLGDDHPKTLRSINNMGHLLNKLSRHDAAALLLLAGEAAARRVWTGDNARWLGNYLAKLGEARAGRAEYPAGEETLLEAHALLSEGFGEDHERTTKTVKRLITLYESWHTAEPGKGYAEKAAEWRAKLPELRETETP